MQQKQIDIIFDEKQSLFLYSLRLFSPQKK